VHFIRLTLTRGSDPVSDNFYLHSLEEIPAPATAGPGGGTLGYNLKAIRSLPKVKVEAATKIARQGSRWAIATELRNTSSQPALMVRVKAVREKSGDRILPRHLQR